jgi:hypothetical protein
MVSKARKEGPGHFAARNPDRIPPMDEPVKQPSDREIRDRLLARLRRLGPECLSQLAVECGVSNARVENILMGMAAGGLVSRRPHEDEGMDYSPDEARWGLATLRHPARSLVG